MLGYSGKHSAWDAFQHHESLKQKVPKEFHKELDHAYLWIKDRNFMTALGNNTVEGWDYLSRCMMNPPLKVISAKKEECKHSSVQFISNIPPVPSVPKPSCRICSKELTDSILHKTKFSIIICKCDKLWCHVDCAEKFVLDSASCTLCKDYFILSPCSSTLRSTFVKR